MTSTDTALDVAARYFDNEIINPLRQVLIGRKLVAENPSVKGDGIYNVDINTIKEMGAASISYSLPTGETGNKDMIRVDRTNVNLPVLYKEFEVPRMDYESFRNKNIPMDTAAAVSAAQMVGVQEDQLIINGWNPNGDGSTFVVPGMYTLTGAQNITTSLAFSTPGNATSAVAAAYGMLETAHALGQAYNLVLNPTSWANLVKSRLPYSNQRELPEVLEMLNFGDPNGPGRIYVTVALATGTGVLAPIKSLLHSSANPPISHSIPFVVL
jgi:uncharacterized linocin/CFP29 family protein